MKKTLLTLLFTFALVISLSAELNKMWISGKAEKTNDIVPAKYQTANRERAACLIIITDLDAELDYQPNVQRVGLTHDKPGEWCFYIAPSERRVDIYAVGYEPLIVILREVGIPVVRSGDVYRLRLTGDKKETMNSLPVIFNVTPADAKIRVGSLSFVSGQAQSLPIGDNEVTVEKEGYRPIKEKIKVNEKNIQFNYNLKEIEPVLVKIRSSPQNANIIIDSVERGLTNRDLWLYPGRYELSLTLTGYLPISEGIEIKETGDNTFNRNLIKNVGVLNISATPKDAEVFINNEKQTRLQGIELTPGPYRVEVKAPSYLIESEQIELKLGQTINKSYSLIKNVGVFNLSVTPFDAEVFINNEKYTQLHGIELAPGPYRIEVRAKSHHSESEQIELKLGQTINRSYNLTMNVGVLNISVIPNNAEVFINNEKQTKLQGVELAPGSYRIEVRAKNHHSQSEQIELTLGQTVNKSYNLIKNVGVLNISVTPNDAEVFINNEKQTKLQWIELAPGPYKIDVKAKSHHSESERIELNLDQTLNKSYNLKAITGNLLLEVSPTDAEVEIIAGNKLVKKVKGSSNVSNLLVGEFILRAKANGHCSEEHKVIIKENENTLYSISLKEDLAQYYMEAAKKGDADAQYNLGVCYYKGLGVDQDYKEAVKWFNRAAKQEHADAQYNLGVCYYEGYGVDQNCKEAMKWYNMAAEKDLAAAQYNLGVCHFERLNYEEAKKWINMAAEQRHEEAMAYDIEAKIEAIAYDIEAKIEAMTHDIEAKIEANKRREFYTSLHGYIINSSIVTDSFTDGYGTNGYGIQLGVVYYQNICTIYSSGLIQLLFLGDFDFSSALSRPYIIFGIVDRLMLGVDSDPYWGINFFTLGAGYLRTSRSHKVRLFLDCEFILEKLSYNFRELDSPDVKDEEEQLLYFAKEEAYYEEKEEKHLLNLCKAEANLEIHTGSSSFVVLTAGLRWGFYTDSADYYYFKDGIQPYFGVGMRF